MLTQLKTLEEKIHELMRLAHDLRGQNFTLRQKIVLVENEKQELQKRITLATSKVEELLDQTTEADLLLINRLKSKSKFLAALFV